MRKVTKESILTMTVTEIREWFIIAKQEEITREERDMVVDDLARRCDEIGRTWDLVCGTDPDKGKPVKYGTPNRRSRTYQLRRAAGYSYP